MTAKWNPSLRSAISILSGILSVCLVGEGIADLSAEDRTTIRQALADLDNNFVPDQLGDVVTVEGVLTRDPAVSPGGSITTTMQDATGGILLVSPNPELLHVGFFKGDRVRVTGQLGQLHGMERLEVQDLVKTGEQELPVPVLIQTAEISSEQLSGKLVEVRGNLKFAAENAVQATGVTLHDATGSVPVRIPADVYLQPGFLKKLLESSEVRLTGIVEQQDETEPFNDHYHLAPRRAEDFHFIQIPPYRSYILTGSMLLLLASVALLWKSRRQAQRSARELASLTANLQKSQAALRDNEARLGLLTEQVPAILWSVDKQFRFTSSTGAGLQALKLKPNAVVGMNLFEYFQTDDPTFGPIAAHRKAMSGESVTFEARWANRIYECHIDPLRNNDHEIVGAISLALDVTERRKTETTLKEQSEALRHSQKMEAIGRLAGGVAHDFNNLVTVIKGYCDLISLKLGPDHDLQDWFDEIKNSANRAASLTSQLLAFSRKQMLEPRVLDLNEILSDMNKLLRRIIGEHIELMTVLSPTLGHVKVDRSQLEQVIMNLAVNAFDAMPKGGKLIVATTNVTLNENDDSHRVQLPPGNYVLLSVSDTGMGMSNEVKSRIFEPFYTTKEMGKGTGLGLATVYGIVTQSGGTISVESQSGKGTTFHIYLPAVDEPIQTEETSMLRQRNTAGTETILLAEDERAVRSLIRQTLEGKGYQVLEARNGAEAMSISQNHPAHIDLLITDVVMPRMSGYRLARQLRQDRPALNILFVSGYAYTGREEGATISPDSFLAKPFSPEILAAKVRKLLNNSQKGASTSTPVRV